METTTSGAQLVLDFVKRIIDTYGPRLPGSNEERLAQKEIAVFMEEETGVKPTVERFKLAPRASIGAIPYLGIVGFLSLILYYLHPLASLVLAACDLIFAIVQVFLYRGWFDKLFKQEESNNTFSVIDGKGTIDHTIVFSAHTDSSWLWQLALKNPNTMIIKTVFGIVGVVVTLACSIIRLILGMTSFTDFSNASVPIFVILSILPLIFIPGLFWLCTYLSYDKKKASPGAMDNLTGIGTAIYMGHYFKENPDKLPDNCRIITAALGSEEAGLKGSEAFMKAHGDDKDLLVDPYFVNLDSLRDYDHFNAVIGDTWQFTKFDEDLKNMLVKAMDNAGVKPNVIKNPVGGCDSTPICKRGFKTITFAAQNPIVTNYYHTTNDTYEGLNEKTLEKSIEILIDLSEQIHESHSKDGYHFSK